MLTKVCRNSVTFGDWYQGINASIRDAIFHLFKMKQEVNDQVSMAEAVTKHTAVINMYFRVPLISSVLLKAGSSLINVRKKAS